MTRQPFAAVSATLDRDEAACRQLASRARTHVRSARPRFRSLKLHEQIRSKHDDGNLGWAENGPFDAILLTCAAPALVMPLLAQLGEPGVLVSPVGTDAAKQKLLRVIKADGAVSEQDLGPVSFVPLLPGVL